MAMRSARIGSIRRECIDHVVVLGERTSSVLNPLHHTSSTTCSASTQEALLRREAGEALADIGRSFNVSHNTISRLLTMARRQRGSAPASITSVSYTLQTGSDVNLFTVICPCWLKLGSSGARNPPVTRRHHRSLTFLCCRTKIERVCSHSRTVLRQICSWPVRSLPIVQCVATMTV